MSHVKGVQRPTHRHVPKYSTSAGQDAIALAAHTGLILNPWQQHVLMDGLGESKDGKWSAFEVATVVSRQNGKGSIFEARQLAGLFLFGEELIIHTAHEFKTASEAFLRIKTRIENTPDLAREVKSIKVGTHEPGITLRNGARLLFVARSGGSGRGFSCDCLILDEAMILGDEQMAAIMPTMSARKNPQLWYGASAGIGEKSVQLARVRKRGLAGADQSLAYFEWSVNVHSRLCMRTCTDHFDLEDPKTWARANPALGYPGAWMTPQFIAKERRAMSPKVFAQERLGVGEYPRLDEDVAWAVIGESEWRDCIDRRSSALDPVSIAVEVRPDRSVASIGVAGMRADGKIHVEVIANRPGTGWIVDRVKELRDRWNPVAVVVDPGGPSGGLIADLTAEGIELTLLATRDLTHACGEFYDGVMNGKIRHLDEPELNAAVASSTKRAISDAWAWERRDPAVDPTPLTAVTLAMHGVLTYVEQGALFIDHL